MQSGKTGNFTGLIARAVDSGYNFVIVLSGLYNSLRNQTQNRLDAELTGIGHKGVDYFVDPPSRPFLRLTKHGEEFDGSVDINKIRLGNPILRLLRRILPVVKDKNHSKATFRLRIRKNKLQLSMTKQITPHKYIYRVPRFNLDKFTYSFYTEFMQIIRICWVYCYAICKFVHRKRVGSF